MNEKKRRDRSGWLSTFGIILIIAGLVIFFADIPTDNFYLILARIFGGIICCIVGFNLVSSYRCE